MSEFFLGDSCFVYGVSQELSLEDNFKILKIYKDICRDDLFIQQYGIYDIVPAYNSIAFHFDYEDMNVFRDAVLSRLEKVDYTKNFDSDVHCISVSYTGEDIQRVSKDLGLSVNEIIKRHSQVEYHIAMLGFKPYLPYLLGLDKSLSMPRLATPRNRINAGSVGIGGAQTTIFPEQTPSGWNIIGVSDFKDFHSLKPGDKIVFREVK